LENSMAITKFQKIPIIQDD